MKQHTSVYHPFARASLASCAILLGASVAFAQSSGTSSASSPSRDTSAGHSGARHSSDTTSSADSNYGTSNKSASDKNTTGSSAVDSGASATTGASAYGGATATDSTTSSATGAGAPTGRDTVTTTSGHKLGFMDRRFVNKAADAGMAEVSLAQLASERASNPEVKRFAQQIVQDHTQVNNELMSLAGQKGVKLDQDDGKDRFYKRLSDRSGADFDEEFVEHMIDQHESDIKLFEKASQGAKDADLRSFAAKHVDHLRQHLKTAQSLRSSIVPTGRDSTSRSGYEADPTMRGSASTPSSGANNPSNSEPSGTSATGSSHSGNTGVTPGHSGTGSSTSGAHNNRRGGR